MIATGVAGSIAAAPLPAAGASSPPHGLFQPLAPSYRAGTLTRDAFDVYELRATTTRGVTAIGGARNAAGNSRGVFWPTGQLPVARQQSCVTLGSKVGPFVQQGVALRIARTPRGAVRAITVTNHVYGNPANPPTFVFNVHVWRSDLTPAFRHVAAIDLRTTLAPYGVALPYPWRLCARVQGRLLMFQVWRAGDPVPRWDDARHGRTLRLPPGTGYAGQAGWYVGHLWANDSASFRDPVVGEPTALPS
jgi:hypothetical protein